MRRHRNRRFPRILLGLFLASMMASVFAHQAKPVSILPGIARKGCTPCHKVTKKCSPCDFRPKFVPSYHPSYIVRVSNFHAIEADGNVVISLTHGRDQQVRIYNNGTYGHKLINAYVHHGVLYLKDKGKSTLGKIKHSPVMVKIDSPSLQRITLHEKASLSASHIKAPDMNINLDSSGYVRLRGDIQLHRINQHGCGRIDVQWVNSDHLHIFASGKGQIRLAGTVGVMEVTAINDAHVDARYLRADNAIVKTADTAEVDVTVHAALSGFASDFSNVYYFKTPEHLTRHTYQSGTVMQLHHWS